MRPELAIDANGQPISVPADAIGMRARRIGGGPGRPELACDAVGRPLLFPLDATFEDVYRAAGPGKYKMIFVNAAGFMLEDGPFGMTGMMQPQPLRNASADGELATTIVGTPGSSFQPRDFRDELLIHLITKQTQMADAVIRGVPAWMQASAELVNAAHNAKLTTRPPVLVPAPAEEPDEAPEPEPEPEPPSRIPGWLKEVIELAVKAVAAQVGHKFAGKLAGGIPLEALFDWSKAAPKPTASGAAPSVAQSAPATSPAAATAPTAMDPGWYDAANGATPTDPAWFAPATGGMAAASAWPAGAAAGHMPADSVWFAPTPSGTVPTHAAWSPAPPSSAPWDPAASYAAGPMPAASPAAAWYGAAAPGAQTSTPSASAPVASTPVDAASYGVLPSEASPSIPPATWMPMTSPATVGAPEMSEDIASAPPPGDAVTIPHGVIAPSTAVTHPLAVNMSAPGTAVLDAELTPGMLGTVELPVSPSGAPPHPSMSSAPIVGASTGALPRTPIGGVPGSPAPSPMARGTPPPPEGNPPLQVRSAGAPRAAPASTALARRGAMVPAPRPPTPLGGTALQPQLIASPPVRRRTNIADSIALPSYIMEIYSALTPQEQELTQKLVAMLTQEERVQWLLELGALNLPDAIARVRDLIRPHT